MLAGIGAAAVVTALVAGLLVWRPWSGDGSGSAPVSNTSSASDEPAAAATLKAAAKQLEQAGVVSYQGSFRNGSGGKTDFDLRSALGGWSQGSLRDAGRTVQLLTADGNRMVKAGTSYWSGKDYADAMAKRFADRWVDADAELPEVGYLATPLAPSNVADLMRSAAAGGRVGAGARTTVDGVSARRFYTPVGRYYVTTAKPYTLVRIESATSVRGPDPGALPDGVNATVTQLTHAADKTFWASLTKSLGQLSTAIDPTVAFSTVGKSSFGRCGNSGCTAKFTFKNTVSDSLRATGSSKGDTSVYAVISVDVTLDGHKVKHCSVTRRMAAEGTTSVSCRATYSSSAYRDHTVRGLPDLWARAVPDAELKRLKADFAKAADAIGGAGSAVTKGTGGTG